MPGDFNFSYKFTKQWEGGYSDHPADTGGATNYGITIGRLRELASNEPAWLGGIGVSTNVTKQTVKELTPEQAEEIYRHSYWQPHDLDAFPRRVAAFLFDCCVNHGWGNAVKFAQRAVNATGANSLAVDSQMGPATKAALMEETDALVSACCDAREKFYRDIVSSRPSQNAFLKGWLNRVNAQRKYLGV